MLAKIFRLLNATPSLRPVASGDQHLRFLPLFSARPFAGLSILLVLFAFAASFALVSSRAQAELVAARITAENFDAYHVGGPDADAGIDDWFLSNGTICAAISDPNHEGAISPRGGVLIDLGHCGANDDQFVLLQPMLNLSQSQVVPVSEIEAGQTGDEAWLRTTARFVGIEIITTYSLSEAEPTSLRLSQTARRVAAGDALFSIGHIVLHTSGQTPVFSLFRGNPETSVGFAYPDSNRRSLTSLLGALIATDLTVLVGAEGMPPISYGFERESVYVVEEGEQKPLGAFSVSGMHFTFLNATTRPPWFGDTNSSPSLLQLAQIPFMDIEGESVLESNYRIHVGARADVAAITDQVFENARIVEGRVDDPSARIHVDLESGAPLTQIRPNPDGRFRLKLAPGHYAIRAEAPGDRSTRATWEIRPSADATAQQMGDLELGPAAWVRLPKPFVGRLTFLAKDGSGPVTFGSSLLGQKMGETLIPGGTEAPYLNLANSPIDPERVIVPPGDYRVIAVRGPEYEAREVEISAAVGEETRLALQPLARVAPTPGWIASDFHVHSGESFDSGLPQPLQIVAFAASGAEVLVATEHDRIVDPRPAIRIAGQTDRLVSITGVEVTGAFVGEGTPYGTTHMNAFPMEPIPKAYRAGAPDLEGRRLRDALADIRELDPAPFVQLNHPRPLSDEEEGDGYFDHMNFVGEPFDPTKPLSAAPNNILLDPSPEHGGIDLDFHGVELMNGESLLRYRRVRADWFSLLLQGHRIIGTANSDSHRLGVIVGSPRTYVAQDKDNLAAFDQTRLLEALRAGRAWGSTGPLLEVSLDDAGIGDLHTGKSGTLRIQVDAAPWIPIAQWRAYVNGELVHRAPIARGESAALPLVFAGDSIITVEVEGPAEGIYASALPGFTPFAFTNPIFVDADGSGRFDAPGLPDSLPTTMTNPDQPD